MSHSSNSKRKRLSKTGSNTPAQIDGLISPSSQDASGEDNDCFTTSSSPSQVPAKRPKNETTIKEQETDSNNDFFTTSSSPSQVPAKRSKNETTVKEQETDSNKVVSLPTIRTENLSFPSPLSSPSDYSYKINPPPVGRPVRIYCDGIYDLFHYGHARSLEQAKKMFENVYLLVGVCDEKITHLKKGKTVLNGEERAESLRHCKWVDEVIEHAPWVIDMEFLDEHQIDFVAHDNIPYASGDTADVYAFLKEEGKFLPTQRTDGVSTSDLITRIVRDYDQYVRRNLERGVSAKELNISFLKKQELHMKKSISEVRSSINKNWRETTTEVKSDFSELKNDLRQTFTVWEERSQELVREFTGMFGVDSVVDKIFRRTRRDSTATETANAEGDSSSGSGNNLTNNTSQQKVNRKKSFDYYFRGKE